MIINKDEKKNSVGKETTNVSRWNVCSHVKNKIVPYLTPYTKINFKSTKDLNARAKTIKLIKKSRRNISSWSKVFLDTIEDALSKQIDKIQT